MLWARLSRVESEVAAQRAKQLDVLAKNIVCRPLRLRAMQVHASVMS